MKGLGYAWINLVQTALRLLPFPCKTGLLVIGNPGRRSPVLVTCNFRLTVERVKRSLQGVDAYLLIANSRGVNVWCAATGGSLTHHDVVAVLKTSGIEELVDHKTVILPQLGATGIEAALVRRRAGWRVVWGPVRAGDLSAFLSSGLEKTRQMSTVSFPWPSRLEMAIAWAFPISLITLLLAVPFGWQPLLPALALVWGLCILIFLTLPAHQMLWADRGKGMGFVFFDFGPHGYPLLVGAAIVLALLGYSSLSEHSFGSLFWPWGFISLILLLVLSLDLTGSTPILKSGLHEDRLFSIVLDEERCRGAGECVEVCPKDVLELDRGRKLASLPRAWQCVQCGACIVQCPFDALYFRSPSGSVVAPETIRRFKLNLLGKRSKPVASLPAHESRQP